MNIAVLGSTRGTDLQPIIDAIRADSLTDVDIKFVLSNKEDAYILTRARDAGLKDIFLDSKGKARTDYDLEVDKLLKEHDVELVLLIGYMKLMSDDFVENWRNKVMNIHPSLLPAFAGGMDLNVHEEVLKRGCRYSGASLIFIDEGADTGPIVLQQVVEVVADETADSLKKKVQRVEQDILIKGIELYRDGKITVEGTIVKIL